MGAMSGAMEWHAWLSSARLEPALVHEYALVLARNELEAGDAAYFDHDFLRSMGIDVAKHRLEILKLARPGPGPAPGERGHRGTSSSAASLSGLVAAVGRAARYVRALVRLRGEPSSSSTALVLVPSQQQPDGHVDVGRSSFGHCKAPKRTRSMPKAPGTTCARSSAARATRPAGGCRGAATVHAMRDAESGGGGGGDETVQWECLFQDLNPN
ncbi:uncharacterized protein LOC125534335 [Triticum urartu]|uniref:uncharacterized protein LOC125534335 n=1 Tax=Triticum urartu TaxID=4572 RepID=UPI002043C90D|nr:uncharacterized protein LOC125534335 [Triticum urartu]